MADPSADEQQRIEAFQSAVRDRVQRHRWVFLLEGLVFLLLGLAAIVFPNVATVAVTLFVGWLFLIGGGVQLITTFGSRDVPAFGWRLGAAVLAIALGGLLLWNPAAGVLTLTAVLTGYLLAVGVVRSLAALRNRDMPHWGLLLGSGLISIALAAVILVGLPLTAAWVLGLIVGIELLFAGIAILGLVWRVGDSARP